MILSPFLSSNNRLPPNCDGNLNPSVFKKRQKKANYKVSEVEYLTAEQMTLKERILECLKTNKDDKKPLLAIYNEVHENSKRLERIKIIDLACAEAKIYFEDSYRLRAEILKNCPTLTTHEVFTKTLQPEKIINRFYLQKAGHWIPERVGHQAKTIVNQSIRMLCLARITFTKIPYTYVVRGTTGAGKSSFLARHFHEAQKAHGEIILRGVLNPDEIKYHLKQIEGSLYNTQVHLEGSILTEACCEGFNKDTLFLNVVREGRFSSLEELDPILQQAYKGLRHIHLVDIASPSLQETFQRVLRRNSFKKDPCPLPGDIVEGYQESIRFRKKILELAKSHYLIKTFQLYGYDASGILHLIAEKKDSRFVILRADLLEACCQEPTHDAIQTELKREIDIEHATRGPIRVRVEDALREKASGTFEILTPRSETNFWGEIRLKKFDKSWLKDLPLVAKHIESEQLLHIRGRDENGKGWHWQAKKFSWGLDANFMPERSIQMQLGYFLIPLNSIEYELSGSVQVLNQIKDEETGCWRFFVHPTAYPLYQKFHKLLTFIKPEKSSFIGTPTSSYRSWVVRRLDKMDPPFIVKMSVLGAQEQRHRLLTPEVIKKSISLQKKLEKVAANKKFIFFPETIGFYPRESPSGIIIREFPEELLKGNYYIYSFSAIQSMERRNHPSLCSLLSSSPFKNHPLIYEIYENMRQKKNVTSWFEFLSVYLINLFYEAIEHPSFQKGFSFALHGQNFCWAIDKSGVPQGFAYRDFEGIFTEGEHFIETFSWFFRYHVLIKLLNVVCQSPTEEMPPPLGAPIQTGQMAPLNERTLGHLLKQPGFDLLQPTDYAHLLKTHDIACATLIKKNIMDCEKLLNLDLPLPAGEIGSLGEEQRALNSKLHESRKKETL